MNNTTTAPTRAYEEIPGYEGRTRLSARYNYLHDLLDKCKGLLPGEAEIFTPCRVMQLPGGCKACSLNKCLGGDESVCCNWRAEADPDRSILEMEALLERRKRVLWARLGDPGLVNRHPYEHWARDPIYWLIQCGWARSQDDTDFRADAVKVIANHYGLHAQMDQAQEELAELIQAISKYRRADGQDEDAMDAAYHGVVEEMADVSIMVDQLRYLLNCDAQIGTVREEKLERQLRRMQEES